jgi:hypothetical protein
MEIEDVDAETEVEFSATVKRAPARPRPPKAKPGTKGLGPAECRIEQPTGAAAEAAEAIAKACGCVVGSYDPQAKRKRAPMLARALRKLGYEVAITPINLATAEYGMHM